MMLVKSLDNLLSDIDMDLDALTADELRDVWVRLEKLRTSKFADAVKERLLNVLEKHGGEYRDLSIKENHRTYWKGDAYKGVIGLAKQYDIPLEKVIKLKSMTALREVFPEGDNSGDPIEQMKSFRVSRQLANSIKIKKLDKCP